MDPYESPPLDQRPILHLPCPTVLLATTKNAQKMSTRAAFDLVMCINTDGGGVQSASQNGPSRHRLITSMGQGINLLWWKCGWI